MNRGNEKRIYKGMYRASWEKNPMLKDWIEAVPGKKDKAFCRFCQRLLYAHRYSVLKHTCTIKHQQNADRFREQLASDENPPSDKKFRAITDDNPSERSQLKSPVYDEEQNVSIAQSECHEAPPTIISKERVDGFQDVIEEEVEEEEYGYTDDENIVRYEEYHFEETDEVSSPTSALETDEMASPHKTLSISTHILDTSRGMAAGNVPVTIFKLENNVWKQINQSTTNEDGRIATLLPGDEYTIGMYKLHFNTAEYLRKTTAKFLYPFIEIAFNCDEVGHYHIPLLLNPFGYSTYRGT